MQILFNELSLTGQFSNAAVFYKNGLLPFISVLKEMQGFSTLLLKKSDVWNSKVTPSATLHAILVNNPQRRSDEIRRFKSAIFELTKEPFWDSDCKQSPDDTYLLEGVDIGGSSPAEACERDRTLVSFTSSSASSDPLQVSRNGINVPLLNLTRSGELTERLWQDRQITFEIYVKARFSKGKLDFTRVDQKMGFSGIQTTEQSLFIDTFKKFEELTWDQIRADQGLEYKEYHGTLDINVKDVKTFKFRASRKIRCHGYRQKDSFVVIGFETDHKLSDQG
ncbi:MAG: hypothetical protein HQ517_13555 [SAR324 cluster bacterium]|nr:hypothetical protein [SAR324 cluster bacterium]